MHTLPLAATLAALLAAGPALAQTPLLVTNPDMCDAPEGTYMGEMGMVLEPTIMSEIEYHCQWDQPLTFDWTTDYTALARVGYCAEPGHISPGVFVFEMSSHEPGQVTVWSQGGDEPTVFRACP